MTRQLIGYEAEVSQLNRKISKYAECAIDPMDAIA